MASFYIRMNTGRFEKVEGYTYRRKYGIHKTGTKNYTITDLNTGLSIIGGMKKLEECRKYLADKENIKEINSRIKNRENYKKYLKELSEYKESNPLASDGSD